MLERDKKVDEVRINNGRKEDDFYDLHQRFFNLYFNTDEDSIDYIIDNIIYEINKRTRRVNQITKNIARVDFYLFKWNRHLLTILLDNMTNKEWTEVANEICRVLGIDNPSGFEFHKDKITFKLPQNINFADFIMYIPKVFI